MNKIDLTYPLYPIVCFAAATLLLLVLLACLVRRRWNRGVLFLCFWLQIENVMAGINGILWSDNADIKLYAYCDIGERIQRCRGPERSRYTQYLNMLVSHLHMITAIVKPMATLIISRRLYLITNLQSVEFSNRAEVRYSTWKAPISPS